MHLQDDSAFCFRTREQRTKTSILTSAKIAQNSLVTIATSLGLLRILCQFYNPRIYVYKGWTIGKAWFSSSQWAHSRWENVESTSNCDVEIILKIRLVWKFTRRWNHDVETTSPSQRGFNVVVIPYIRRSSHAFPHIVMAGVAMGWACPPPLFARACSTLALWQKVGVGIPTLMHKFKSLVNMLKLHTNY